MPFALIPDNYKLQKVSKLQKEAIDQFYRSQNIDSFLDGQASGELVKAVAIVVTPIVLAALAKQGIDGLDPGKFIDSILKQIPGFDLSALGEIKIQ
jgi:hypothetical protein